jgi:alanine dehydrogenase
MALLLREDDVRSLLTMDEVIEVVEDSFRQMAEGRAGLIPRRRLMAPSGTFHLMAGSLLEGGYVAFKAYTATASGVRFLVGLYSFEGGELLALIEADWLGRMRTGAATGVAVKHLTGPGPVVLGVVGAGRQAFTQVLAVAAVRRLAGVRVASRRLERAQRMCQLLESSGIAAQAVASAQEACQGADVVVTATTSRDPVVFGRWLQPSTMVAAVGSNWPNRREVDDEVVRAAALIVVDSLEQARIEAGDLIIPAARGIRGWEGVVELAEVVAGRVARPPDGCILFKSVGLGTEDAAAAALVFRKAVEAGLGEQIRLFGQLLP